MANSYQQAQALASIFPSWASAQARGLDWGSLESVCHLLLRTFQLLSKVWPHGNEAGVFHVGTLLCRYHVVTTSTAAETCAGADGRHSRGRSLLEPSKAGELVCLYRRVRGSVSDTTTSIFAARATTALFSISTLKIEIMDTHAEEAAQSVKAANITSMKGRVPWSMIETPTVRKAGHV